MNNNYYETNISFVGGVKVLISLWNCCSELAESDLLKINTIYLIKY